MAVNVCVLRSGGEYGPEHVRWLARQVPGLICLSDVPVAGVETVPLEHDWPGWWAKLELFSGSIDGDLMFFDLDTVVFRVPDVDRTTVLRDFYYPDRMGSGLMYIAEQDKQRIWQAWMDNPVAHMRRAGRGGDQAFLQGCIGGAQKWQDVAGVYSFKVHCRRGLPDDADIVCFHGKPRPWASGATWVPSLT